ncbi:hypothetical protein Micbo1qcDRAFT_222283 [Microdochium bolleyi]|uniref:AB hydrolase-1 domain-containing protein n=1 Tax=Microdochium bolleyi TaxID=196109 RepID=A0A136J5U3_9PEZI|nr:hypothetical protein Micbo1qcDRAFT_222283 [Microdochium bolleyi]
MLIDHSGPALLLVRCGIWLFGYLGFGCFIYFLLALFIFGLPGISHPVSIAIECIGAIEILWYLLWYLPYRLYLGRPGLPLDTITKDERHGLYRKLITNIPDAHLFMRKWFCNAHLDEIYREDIKDWLLWALWNKWHRPEEDMEENEELEHLIDEWEEHTGMHFRKGRGGATAIRASLDPVATRHASLLWYWTVGALDLLTTAWLMIWLGFRFYRQPLLSFFTNFPFRPMTLLSPRRSAAPSFSYFYRPVVNPKTGGPKKRTVVFMHGIGMGLSAYLMWLNSLPKDIGLLLVEFMPVSSRICPQAVSQREFVSSMRAILSQHSLEDVVLVGHSYGTLMVRSLLDDPIVNSKVHSVILIDPASIMMHMPELGYNIMKRKPETAPQLEMQWFAAADPRTAHTLTRRLHWQDCILWREQLLEKRTTVVVASRDCVTSPSATASYVYYGHVNYHESDKKEWRKTPDTWTGRGELELFYLWDRDHGQGLLAPGEIKRINRIVPLADEEKPSAMAVENSSHAESMVDPGEQTNEKHYSAITNSAAV